MAAFHGRRRHEGASTQIADYEVRRELLRANKARGLERLDLLKQTLEYLPLSTAMLRAAQLWGRRDVQDWPPQTAMPWIAT